MDRPLNSVYFAHGMESGPWGTKIKRLGRIARAMGFHVESIDYQGMMDPDRRVEKLLSLKPAALDHLVLVGSSMGGYVAAAASEVLKPQGLFLMAPAVLIEGFGKKPPVPHGGVCTAVHGWHDEIVPVENVLTFSRRHGISLHLLNCGHTLKEVLPLVENLFEDFLNQVISASRTETFDV